MCHFETLAIARYSGNQNNRTGNRSAFNSPICSAHVIAVKLLRGPFPFRNGLVASTYEFFVIPTAVHKVGTDHIHTIAVLIP
jgi:hypothetical protein